MASSAGCAPHQMVRVWPFVFQPYGHAAVSSRAHAVDQIPGGNSRTDFARRICSLRCCFARQQDSAACGLQAELHKSACSGLKPGRLAKFKKRRTGGAVRRPFASHRDRNTGQPTERQHSAAEGGTRDRLPLVRRTIRHLARGIVTVGRDPVSRSRDLRGSASAASRARSRSFGRASKN